MPSGGSARCGAGSITTGAPDVSSDVRAEPQARQRPMAEEAEPPDTPKSFDTRDPTAPTGVIVEVYRSLRDTALARRIKERHHYECQVCGESVQLLRDKRYAEGHHIKPLGRMYGGEDREGTFSASVRGATYCSTMARSGSSLPRCGRRRVTRWMRRWWSITTKSCTRRNSA